MTKSVGFSPNNIAAATLLPARDSAIPGKVGHQAVSLKRHFHHTVERRKVHVNPAIDLLDGALQYGDEAEERSLGSNEDGHVLLGVFLLGDRHEHRGQIFSSRRS